MIDSQKVICDLLTFVKSDLDLDVSRLIDELLDEHPVVAKGGGALFRAQVESFPDLGVAVGHAHALAAAASRGL